MSEPRPRPTVRRAEAADAGAIADLAERTFRDAFAGDNDPDDIEAYVREAFSVETMRDELLDPASTFLVAFLPGAEAPTGYAKLRAGRADPSVEGSRPVELERIYVDRPAIGRGVGAVLLVASLDAAAAAGHRTMWLGVWEHNARAIAFYERWGFHTVGSHVFRLGKDRQRDVIMQRALTSGRPTSGGVGSVHP